MPASENPTVILAVHGEQPIGVPLSLVEFVAEHLLIAIDGGIDGLPIPNAAGELVPDQVKHEYAFDCEAQANELLARLTPEQLVKVQAHAGALIYAVIASLYRMSGQSSIGGNA